MVISVSVTSFVLDVGEEVETSELVAISVVTFVVISVVTSVVISVVMSGLSVGFVKN